MSLCSRKQYGRHESFRDVFGHEIPSDTNRRMLGCESIRMGDRRIAGGIGNGRLLSMEEKPSPGIIREISSLLVKTLMQRIWAFRVYPDDEARRFMRTDRWKDRVPVYFDCDPGTRLSSGQHAGSHVRWEAAIRGHQWDELSQ